jgi:hypothetical protein
VLCLFRGGRKLTSNEGDLSAPVLLLEFAQGMPRVAFAIEKRARELDRSDGMAG